MDLKSKLKIKDKTRESFQNHKGSLSTVVGWKKLRSRKDEFGPFFFDAESDENPFVEIFKVSKTKGISLDKFNEIISRF